MNTKIKFTDLNRRKEVQISRLRLGKVNLNERLFLIKKHENGLCAYVKSEKTLNICCWIVINKIFIRNTCIAYKMDFNIKNLLDVGCTQNAVFRFVSLIHDGKMV